MKSLLEFLTSFYWIAIPETILQTFRYADWRKARERGLGGLLKEAVASLLGTNTWPFFVPLESTWDGSSIARLLNRQGIKMWGYGFANGELFFRVRRSQAAWAQYVLLREGVPLLHRLLNEKPAPASRPGARRTPEPRTQRGEGPAGSMARLESLVESADNQLVSLAESISSAFE